MSDHGKYAGLVEAARTLSKACDDYFDRLQARTKILEAQDHLRDELAKLEPPTVDPDVLAVREIMAERATEDDCPGVPSEYLRGGYDNSNAFRAHLATYRAGLEAGRSGQ